MPEKKTYKESFDFNKTNFSFETIAYQKYKNEKILPTVYLDSKLIFKFDHTNDFLEFIDLVEKILKIYYQNGESDKFYIEDGTLKLDNRPLDIFDTTYLSGTAMDKYLKDEKNMKLFVKLLNRCTKEKIYLDYFEKAKQSIILSYKPAINLSYKSAKLLLKKILSEENLYYLSNFYLSQHQTDNPYLKQLERILKSQYSKLNYSTLWGGVLFKYILKNGYHFLADDKRDLNAALKQLKMLFPYGMKFDYTYSVTKDGIKAKELNGPISTFKDSAAKTLYFKKNKNGNYDILLKTKNNEIYNLGQIKLTNFLKEILED